MDQSSCRCKKTFHLVAASWQLAMCCHKLREGGAPGQAGRQGGTLALRTGHPCTTTTLPSLHSSFIPLSVCLHTTTSHTPSLSHLPSPFQPSPAPLTHLQHPRPSLPTPSRSSFKIPHVPVSLKQLRVRVPGLCLVWAACPIICDTGTPFRPLNH